MIWLKKNWDPSDLVVNLFEIRMLGRLIDLKFIWLCYDLKYKWFGDQLLRGSGDVVPNWFEIQAVWLSADEILMIWSRIHLRFKNEVRNAFIKNQTLKFKNEAFLSDILQKLAC